MAYAPTGHTGHVYRQQTAATIDHTAEDSGKLLLRLLVGLLLLAHGIAKIQSGPAEIIDTVTQAGWPSAIAYLVYVGEVAAPVLMIVGFWTRPAALVAMASMVVAVFLAHRQDLLALNPQGGYALELQAFYLFGALAVALLGAGRHSLGGHDGNLN